MLHPAPFKCLSERITPPKSSRMSHRGLKFQSSMNKISDLETNIFDLNMVMKSGLVFFCFFFLKFYQHSAKNLPIMAEMAWHWQVSRYLRRGTQDFKMKNLDHFSPSFEAKKQVFHDLRFQSLILGAKHIYLDYVRRSS